MGTKSANEHFEINIFGFTLIQKQSAWIVNYRYRVLNALSQSVNVHAYGFTLVCTRTCIFKLYDVRNALRHPSSEHLNLYSPENRTILQISAIECDEDARL